jgi:hypothetical protein
MNRYPHYLSLMVATVILCGQVNLRAEITTTNTPVLSNSIPASIFDGNLPNGRDPFFPRSGRRALEVTAADTSAADPTSLTLQGLSHATKRPLATINNQTFQAGEEGEVITPTGRLRIRCEEVKTDSVVISIGGSQRLELRLPQHY